MLKYKHSITILLLSFFFLFTFDLSKLKLGLDLKGGSSLLFSTEDHTSKFIKTLRLDLVHIISKNDIITSSLSVKTFEEGVIAKITLEDLEDLELLKSTLNNYHYKYIVNNNSFIIKYSSDFLRNDFSHKMQDVINKIKNRLDQYGLSEPYVIKEGIDKIYIELPGVTTVNDLNNNIKLIQTPAQLSFRPVLNMSETNTEDSYLGEHDGYFYTLGYQVVSGNNITSANTFFENGSPGVSFKLDSLGADSFAHYTQENIGKQLAIVLDGKVLSAPRIGSRIGGGQAQITGNYTIEETKLLAISLKSGSLPLKIELQESKLIGPSLGEKNIKHGLLSISIGFLLVLLFLVFYYGKNGLLILAALTFNILLVSLIVYSFGFVLTLPGIAGLILTIGMAVDANIIIQERIKEVYKGDNDYAKAINNGYSEAKVAIFDANLTTMFVGIILYSYGTGPLKGFALLLIVGIITSIYTSVYFTEELQKNITKYYGEKNA